MKHLFFSILLIVFFFLPRGIFGQGKAKVIQETIEWISQRFGKSALREGSQALTLQLEKGVAKYGDDFIRAVRAVGPKAFQLVEEAGASQASRVIGILARQGEKGLVSIVERPLAMKVVTQFGQAAENALVKHPAVAEGVIGKFGGKAIGAMESLGPQAGRRLAMLTESGELAKLGRSDELLGVIAKFGEKAMSFIWNHKGSLAVASALGVFLANPEPIIEGTIKLTGEAVTSIAKPIAEIPGVIAKEAASRLDWTLIVLVLMAMLALLYAWKIYRKYRKPVPVIS